MAKPRDRKVSLNPVNVPLTILSGAVLGSISAWRYLDSPTIIRVGIPGAVLKLIVRPIRKRARR